MIETGGGVVTPELIGICAVGIALLTFMWNLHRDIAGLRERMARLEGLFEGFTARPRGSEEPN